jgi:3D (Asp-Asp-Asp) domain-containing protein
MVVKIANIVLVTAMLSGFALGDQDPVAVSGSYIATAYDQHGITKSGDYVHGHVVAADPDLLPIGSRIKIRHAGRYSGEYVVADTGGKIQGRRLDIFIPDLRACRKFGRRRVRVQVISLGDGTHQATREASHEVKQDVKQDLEKSVVGNAATEQDWNVKKAQENKGVPPPIATEKAAAAADPPKTAPAPAQPPPQQ